MNRNALIMLAKAPYKDIVKTRLSGHMTDADRLSLYISLLEGTVSRLRNIPDCDSFISYSPKDAAGYFSRFGLRAFPQSEGDIGDRMFNALNKVLDDGYEKAALVGVDIPDISPSTVLKAFKLLDGDDIVFGPAEDGGYYLVGLKMPIRDIFKEIEWSTKRTLKQSIVRAERYGHRVALTETLYDIDTIEDVEKFFFR
jgi:rSAM/selenodomain-associated transferase 1